MAKPNERNRIELAMRLCDHAMSVCACCGCACGELNSLGDVIGADIPADSPPDPNKESKRRAVMWDGSL